jgi:serine/threonine-protein kinase RsbW
MRLSYSAASAYHNTQKEVTMAGEQKKECHFQAERMILSLDLNLRAQVKAIRPVIDHIMEKVREMGCAEGKEFEVETSIHEAVVNAVVHGCKLDPECRVQVSVACDVDSGLLVIVRDPGPGFDPATIPSPIEAERLFEEHGRGIYLINQLMDDVRIEKGGTEIWMHKK